MAYCSISPRYHWRDEWSGDALRSVLNRTLRQTGLASGDVGRIRDLAPDGRTASGRVARLAIITSSGTISVDGPRIRRVLETTNGEILRSNAFELTVSRDGGSVSRLVVNGMGAGHGVGMCQWGAVGAPAPGSATPRFWRHTFGEPSFSAITEPVLTAARPREETR